MALMHVDQRSMAATKRRRYDNEGKILAVWSVHLLDASFLDCPFQLFASKNWILFMVTRDDATRKGCVQTAS